MKKLFFRLLLLLALANPFTLAWIAEQYVIEDALEPADVTLTEADMQAKVNAIAFYESQISTFWPSLPAMEADVRRAFTDPATGAFVERFWKLSR